jgi:hypothetical protein
MCCSKSQKVSFLFLGSRPGALFNATLGEFLECKPLRNMAGFFLSVHKQKSSATTGSDVVVIKDWQHGAISQFVRFVRPRILPSHCDPATDLSLPLFPSSRGKPLNSFSDCLGVFFELAQREVDRHICATSFRSLHASLGQLSELQEIRADLPSLMGHNQRRACATYFRDEAKAAKRARIQQHLLGGIGAVSPPRTPLEKYPLETLPGTPPGAVAKK